MKVVNMYLSRAQTENDDRCNRIVCMYAAGLSKYVHCVVSMYVNRVAS